MELSFAVLTGKNRLWILQLLLRPYQRTTKKCLWPLFLVSFIALLLSWTSSAEKNWPPKTETGILLFSDFFPPRGKWGEFQISLLSFFSSLPSRENERITVPFVPSSRKNDTTKFDPVSINQRLKTSPPALDYYTAGINNCNDRPFLRPRTLRHVVLDNRWKTVSNGGIETFGFTRNDAAGRGTRERVCRSVCRTVFSPVSPRI